MNRNDIKQLIESYDQMALNILEEDISTILGPSIAKRIIKHFNKKQYGLQIHPFSEENPNLIIKDIETIVQKSPKTPQLLTIKNIIDKTKNNPNLALTNLTWYLKSQK